MDETSSVNDYRCRYHTSETSVKKGRQTDLALSFPIADVVDETAPASFHVGARTNEHVAGRHDICYGRTAGILSGNPDRDRDVVGCSTEDDGKEAMQAEQKLSAAVIVGYVSRQRTV